MKKGLTELVFILDRSGSMSGLESDTIGGYNSMLEKQKKESGEAIITTVLFDDQYELLHDRISLKGVKPITDRDYFVRGTTALLDAVGKTINKIGNAQKHTAVEEQAERVMFVITTDGLENSSREFNLTTVRQLVERQKEKYGWEFLF
ncbi:MAG: VWA domain-containing protein, partial [Clostridiales bacterium]|nr:VWA domain-containing protein [Clostridiales bacterium]